MNLWLPFFILARYTADFDREKEARGMLVRLADRRKRAKVKAHRAPRHRSLRHA